MSNIALSSIHNGLPRGENGPFVINPLLIFFSKLSFFPCECRLFLSRPNLINPSTRLPEIDRINSDGATDSIVKQHIPWRQWIKICSFNFSNSIRYLWHILCIVYISSFNFYRPLREFLPCVSEKTLLDFSQFLVKK